VPATPPVVAAAATLDGKPIQIDTTADEGGRKAPIIGDFYSCPLFVDGQAFECRIFLETKGVEPGDGIDSL